MALITPWRDSFILKSINRMKHSREYIVEFFGEFRKLNICKLEKYVNK